jgi:hypothetical protein
LRYRYDDGSRLILRYLQGCAWNYEQTQQVVNEHYLFLQSTFPLDNTPFKDVINEGMVYSYKRDKGQRPIIVINVERILATKVKKY